MIQEVILDGGETPNKCTIAPLAGRGDFRIIPVRGSQPLGPLSAPILLHPDGKCLTSLKLTEVHALATIDCVWPRLNTLLKRIVAPLPQLAKIPGGFVTAYPRRCSEDFDPDGGLATIEAIFIANALLGNWDPGLLSAYHFGRELIEKNRERFLELGLKQASDEALLPIKTRQARNSRQRRIDRGKPEFGRSP